MASCENKVTQTIKSGWEWNFAKSPCGSTGINGKRLVCDDCKKELEKKYPQGWRNAPGDTCKHGTYISDPYGPDILCGLCEEE